MTVFLSLSKHQAGKLKPVGDRVETCLQEELRVSPVLMCVLCRQVQSVVSLSMEAIPICTDGMYTDLST